jgi:hypothetical protein
MRTEMMIATLVFFVTPLQAQQLLHEGKWEFEIGYDFIGVPQKFPGYRKTQCITRDAPLPKISRPGHECQRQQQRQFGRTYTWFVDCTTEWEMAQGMGRIHYWDDRARGDVHVQVINPYTPPQPMVFRIRGKRLGACD